MTKVALVTGGTRGIGAAISRALQEAGHKVAASYAGNDEAAAKFQAETNIPVFKWDVGDYDACAAGIAKVEADIGPIDILVNNAANDDRHKVEEVTPEYWDNRMAVNLRHLFFAAQAVAPSMKANGGGAIINLGSISWHLALPEIALYQTAKAAIEGMTRALARDLGEDNIRVTCVVPGGVKTPRQMRLWHNPEEEARMLGLQCLKQRVEPRDIAAMVLFLASDDARLCTAHNYFVDAGWR